MRVCVVGNGIIGSLVTLHLAGLDEVETVEIWGPGQRNRAGSTAAAAMLNSYAEIDRHTFANKINTERFSHSRLAAELWEDLDRSVFDGGVFSAGGHGTFVLRTGSADSLEDENWRLMVRALQDFSEHFEVVAGREVPGYFPRRGFEAAEALWIEKEGWMDPTVVFRLIENVLDRSPKVSINHSEATRIRENGALVSVQSDSGGEVDFDKVVIAAGYRSLELADQFLRDFPGRPQVLAGEGVTVRLQVNGSEQEGVVRTANRGLACGLYSAPYRGELVVGASNHVTLNPSLRPSLEAVRSILTMASNELNSGLSEAGLTQINYGIRPISTDGVPMIGLVSEQVFLISGTRRDGWHMAPLIAQYVADTLHSGESASTESMNIYSPQRKSYKFLSVEDSVSEAVQHYMSGLVQHGYTAAFGAYEQHLLNNYKQYFEKLHDDLGLDFGLPIDMVGIAGRLRDSGLPYDY